MMNSTLKYYEKNSERFIQDTLNKEMQVQYDIFEKYLHKDAHILDAGCGSGRDSLYFKSRGYSVTAFDASLKMCDFASDLLDEEVIMLRFEEMEFENSFDAVWASASLLHVSKEEMSSVLNRLALALKEKGLFYASFKHEERELIKEERFFNSYTKESFSRLVNSSPFHIEELFLLEDTRPERRGEFWLNAVLTVNKG